MAKTLTPDFSQVNKEVKEKRKTVLTV